MYINISFQVLQTLIWSVLCLVRLWRHYRKIKGKEDGDYLKILNLIQIKIQRKINFQQLHQMDYHLYLSHQLLLHQINLINKLMIKNNRNNNSINLLQTLLMKDKILYKRRFVLYLFFYIWMWNNWLFELNIFFIFVIRISFHTFFE